MEENKKSSFMESVAAWIVDKKILMFILFLAAAIFCAFSRNWVLVNDDLNHFLPKTTETRIGLDLMDTEFITFGSARVMVENVTYDQALRLQSRIEEIDGVRAVDFDNSEDHYRSTAALFSVTFNAEENDDVSIKALADIRAELSDYDLYISSTVGNPLKAIISSEMLIVDMIAVFIVITVLLITSQTYGEIPVLLITFGAAALLNMGTNFLMGEISFVTDSIAIVLQLALGIDYAIILFHRYMEEHMDKAPREAAIAALSKAIPEISSSSLTTIAGLLALCFMQFKLGYDMGVVLIKAIFLSLASVFLLMPGLLVVFSKMIDRTHHKSFVPKINFLGKFVYFTRYVVPVLFLGVLIASTIFSNRVTYAYSPYSVSSIRKNEEQIAKKLIDETFGKTNQMALLVPKGDRTKEEKMISELSSLTAVKSVLGLANIEVSDDYDYTLTSVLTPRQFAEFADLDFEVSRTLFFSYAMDIDEYGQAITNPNNYSVTLVDLIDYLLAKRNDVNLNLDEETLDKLDDLETELETAELQLEGENWNRIVIELNLPIEATESYAYLELIHGIAGKYYDTTYLVGDTTSCRDLRESFETDNLLISALTIMFVISVLIFTFKSFGLPVLLIMIIEGSIMCNFSVPYLKGNMLFFLTYLIISSIQMGANIDYAIVISSRYMELKNMMPLKNAMIETLNLAFPTIITSGTMLCSAGFVIGYMTSDETISTIGIYLGVGTLFSIILVMCVLPQILLAGDILIRKTTFTIDRPAKLTSKAGLMRIDGHVRGNLDGFIDAEVHGLYYGTMNAIVDMHTLQDVKDEGWMLEHDLGINQNADGNENEEL